MWLNHPCLLNINQRSNELLTVRMVVRKSWDVFTKRVFVEKYISGIMCENPGPLSLFSLCPFMNREIDFPKNIFSLQNSAS